MRLKSKAISFYLLLILTSTISFSQPILEWEQTFGGTTWDQGSTVLQMDDGGYLVAGRTGSTDGDIPGFQQNREIWIMKLDETGALIWQKFYGGNGSDSVYSMVKTSDGGVLVLAESYSSDQDVSNNYGDGDWWLFKINLVGDIEWEQNYGGSNIDAAFSIYRTSDDNYLLSGYSWSLDNDLTTNNGFGDWWVVKLNNSGEILWQKTLGGPSGDSALDIIEDNTGRYACIGYSIWNGNSGDFTQTNGPNDLDAWIVKLGLNGTVQWKKHFGGGAQDFLSSIIQTDDGGFMAVGFSESDDFDLTSNNGERDIWLLKISHIGNKLWSKSFGGTGSESIRDIKALGNDRYLLSGNSSSNDNDILGNNGDQDAWVWIIDGEGNIEWGENIGGSKNDYLNDLKLTNDGGFILTGYSESDDFDVSENQGDSDLWVVKYGGLPVNVTNTTDEQKLKLFPNPSPSGIFYIKGYSSLAGSVNFQCTDSFGRILKEGELFDNKLSLEGLPTGIYGVKIYTAERAETIKLCIP